MKIAQIAPLCEAVPPRAYGGTERVVAYLADALVELGCDVTLFASAESNTRARLVAMRDQAIRLDPHPLKSELAAQLAMLKQVRARAHEFDLLHFHLEPLQFPLFEQVAHRTLTTMHGRLDCKDFGALYRAWPQYPLVSISHRQRAPLAAAYCIGTVPHGIPLASYPFCPRSSAGYLAFLGRISPEKRPDVAIRIARRAGVPLRIAAKVDQVDVEYFRETIRPLLDDPLVEYIGEIGDTDKAAFLGNALALLFPIDWPEPFGLVMIEAMASGTPVIAWNRGSVPEVIDEGVTGRIVESEEAAVHAVEWARQADRARIRQVFERRFSAHTMARRYMDIYHHLLHPRKPLALLPGNAAAIGAGTVAATGVGTGITAASHAATVIAGGAL
jgi:glycosyltransferase involved in cell wall biosynthesis